MSKKLSSYQKLKAENERLRQEIDLLVMHPDSQAATMIKIHHKMKVDIDEQLMSGDIFKNTGLSGLIKCKDLDFGFTKAMNDLALNHKEPTKKRF